MSSSGTSSARSSSSRSWSSGHRQWATIGSAAATLAAALAPTREQAWRTLTRYTTSEALLRHALAVEAATAAYARRFEENEELWRVTALLHDFDCEIHPTLDRHPQDGAPILREEGYPEEVIEAVLSHSEQMSIPRDTLLKRTLFACDELSAFVHACGQVRPTGLDGLEPRFVRERLKQPTFAAGVSRHDVAAGAELLGLELDDHIANIVEALRPIAHDLGLRTAEKAGAPERGEALTAVPAAVRPAMITNLWYAQYFGLDQLTTTGGRLGLAFLRATYRGTLIITILTRWSFPAAILASFLRRRQVVLLEFQHLPVYRWQAIVVRLLRPLVSRGIAAAQVLSSWEVEACHKWLGIPSERIRFIPWPLHGVDPGPTTRSGYVLASGRAACDWESLFRAAEGTEWPLIVVCGEIDAREVERLNAGGRAKVFVDIPRDQHHRLLKEASVYVLPLAERHHSAGHIRIMDAMSTMTPVVTTSIRGLVDYVVPGESAIVVGPGDVVGLREGIDLLLGDQTLGRRLAERALDIFGTRTLADYEKQIRDLVYSATERS
jgi:putative nucleotidyltransferase with HDIG domain